MMIPILLVVLLIVAVGCMGIVDPCSTDEMMGNTSCIDQLSETEKLAAQVDYMMQELAACGGTTYTPDTLQAAAACLEALSNERLMSIDVYTAYLDAVAAGASASLDMDDIQTNIKCLRILSPHELTAFRTFLLCQLRECL